MARILYIDDHIAAQKLIESLLKNGGHQVALARDGHDGLEQMQLTGFDLVITDAVMPGGISGFDVTKTLRKTFSADKLPIILLTGRREKRDVQRAIEAGVSDYVVKPVDPVGFMAKVEAALRAAAQAAPAADAPFEVTLSEVAYVQTTLNVTSISERGVTIRSSQAFKPGAEVDLGPDFFKRLGLDLTPKLLVVKCDSLPAAQFRIEVKFSGVSETSLRALRLWISANQSRKTA